MATHDGEPSPGRRPALGGLPVVGQPPAERADAARNRRKIFDAAVRLAAEAGVEALAMDDVARAAGVGVGTVYRRFGDRAGLILALIDHDEQEFQAMFLHGPPPLGPGAPARTRISAFLRAIVERIETEGPFMLVAESSGPHNRYGQAYALHHAHLTTLIADVAPGADASYLADALLAPLSASLVTYQRNDRGMSLQRIQAGIEAVLDAVLDAQDSGTRS